MTEDEIEQKIYDSVRNKINHVSWTQKDFLTIARIATKRGYGMTFMGVSHQLNG